MGDPHRFEPRKSDVPRWALLRFRISQWRRRNRVWTWFRVLCLRIAVGRYWQNVVETSEAWPSGGGRFADVVVRHDGRWTHFDGSWARDLALTVRRHRQPGRKWA